MDHLGAILPSLQEGLWAVSIDLTDAYLHVPIRASHQRFLRFALMSGEHFQFRCLCFGLRTAPRVFTKMVAELGAVLRQQGVTIFQYLDDWLLVHRDRQVLLDNLYLLLGTVTRTGFLVNWAKSDLVPSRTFVYLGVAFNLEAGLISPSPDRLLRLLDALAFIRSHRGGPVWAWLHLLGILASCIGIVPWARLRMRPLQLFLLSQWRPISRNVLVFVALPTPMLQHLQWWAVRDNLTVGVPIKELPAQVTLVTDASTSWGWGGFLVQGPFAQGQWTDSERSRHINWLELMAVLKCLISLKDKVAGKSVLLQTDNTSVVCYVNKQGGTRSAALCYLAWDVWMWCQEQGVTLRAVHLAGASNTLADMLSRKAVSPLEWSLDKGVVRSLFGILGRPHVDLFASSDNAQLPTFCTWRQDPRALAMDAFSIPWTGMWGYAFPPIALLVKVLNKVERDKCRVLLIAPVWPRRHWYTRLLSLLWQEPVLLPDKPRLLTQQKGKLVHPKPAVFKLAAWPLSGNLTENRDFLGCLPSYLKAQCGDLPELSTPAGSRSLCAGVVNGTRIRFRQM
jgi:hypothetical protein